MAESSSPKAREGYENLSVKNPRTGNTVSFTVRKTGKDEPNDPVRDILEQRIKRGDLEKA